LIGAHLIAQRLYAIECCLEFLLETLVFRHDSRGAASAGQDPDRFLVLPARICFLEFV
jgi:hypothetical protein